MYAEPPSLTFAALDAIPATTRACTAPSTLSKRANSDHSVALTYLTSEADSTGDGSDNNTASSCSSSSRPPPPPKINRTNDLLPASLQDKYRLVQIALYPALLPLRKLLPQPQDPLSPTLRTMGIEVDYFESHPVPCPKCMKSAYTHPTRPGVLFTVFFECPHITDSEIQRLPSRSIAALLERAGHTNVPAFRGNVVVFKHHVDACTTASNADLPVVDVEAGDLPAIEQILVDVLLQLSAHALADPASPARVYFMDASQAAAHNLATLDMRIQTFSWTQNESIASIRRLTSALVALLQRLLAFLPRFLPPTMNSNAPMYLFCKPALYLEPGADDPRITPHKPYRLFLVIRGPKAGAYSSRESVRQANLGGGYTMVLCHSWIEVLRTWASLCGFEHAPHSLNDDEIMYGLGRAPSPPPTSSEWPSPTPSMENPPGASPPPSLTSNPTQNPVSAPAGALPAPSLAVAGPQKSILEKLGRATSPSAPVTPPRCVFPAPVTPPRCAFPLAMHLTHVRSPLPSKNIAQELQRRLELLTQPMEDDHNNNNNNNDHTNDDDDPFLCEMDTSVPSLDSGDDSISLSSMSTPSSLSSLSISPTSTPDAPPASPSAIRFIVPLQNLDNMPRRPHF
uniref:Uncharacterized protein n=1 Tax=Mycena chlorophos TaxID=658473 RepID=A0ABQ0LR80_MYCCL|nr:predicted protein [Mycena chlorophos]